MPYITQWVDPEVFLEHEGVKIFHTYKDDDWANGPMTYWYSTSDNDGENQFDVRDLRLCASDPDQVVDALTHPPLLKETSAYQEKMSGELTNEQEVITEIIRRAIEQGLLKQDEPYPA